MGRASRVDDRSRDSGVGTEQGTGKKQRLNKSLESLPERKRTRNKGPSAATEVGIARD